MGKKASLNKEFLDKGLMPAEGEGELSPEPSGFGAKIAGVYHNLFGIIKLILGLCLLPLVYSSVVSFLSELSLISRPLQDDFWWGVSGFLAIYLFIWEPLVIYTKGHKILEFIFNFFKPLVRVAPYLLPIYTVVIFLCYGLLSLFIKSGWLLEWAVFLSGFSVVLHLVFSAKTLRSKKQDFLKANYIFGFSFIVILNLALLALFFNLVLKEFSFVRFVNTASLRAWSLTVALFNQLFCNRPGR